MFSVENQGFSCFEYIFENTIFSQFLNHHLDIILTSSWHQEIDFFLWFFRHFLQFFLTVLVDFWVGLGVDFGRSGGRFLSIFGSTLGGRGVDFGRSGADFGRLFFSTFFLTGRPGQLDPRFTGVTRMGPPVYRCNPNGNPEWETRMGSRVRALRF